MAANTVGFLGGGRVAHILLGGWQRTGKMPVEVVIHDPDPHAVRQLQEKFPMVRVCPDPDWLLGKMKWIFVAVHPPALLEAVRPLAGKLREDAAVISLAPKISLAKLIEALAGFSRIVRMIPNAPSLIGAGFNPLAFASGLTDQDQREILGILEPLGACPVVPEPHLEAYAVLTAMGPTYFWFQLEELRSLGRSFGLSGEAVDRGLEAMMIGAARLLLSSGLAAEEVMDLIPVRPMQDQEAAIRSAYQEKLQGIYRKLNSV